MKKITVRISDDLYLLVKIMGAEKSLSLQAMLESDLRQRVKMHQKRKDVKNGKKIC